MMSIPSLMKFLIILLSVSVLLSFVQLAHSLCYVLTTTNYFIGEVSFSIYGFAGWLIFLRARYSKFQSAAGANSFLD